MDVNEQEADRVVDAVMKMPGPQAASGDVLHIQRGAPHARKMNCKDSR